MKTLPELIKQYGQYRVQQWANMGYQRYLKNQSQKTKRKLSLDTTKRVNKILKDLPADQLARLKSRILTD